MNYTALKKYRQTAATGLSSSRNVALLLEQVADHVNAMRKAIQENEVETRVNECNRATLILRGLEESVLVNNDSSTTAILVIKRYYTLFQNLIFISSINNDNERAKSIEKSLRDMAMFWRYIDDHMNNIQNSNAIPSTMKSFSHSV